MPGKKNLYMVHRWLGLIVSVQLLAWSIGGFVFSILDIENVRGSRDAAITKGATPSFANVQVAPLEAIRRISNDKDVDDPVHKLVLRERHGRIVYELFGANEQPLATVDAIGGVTSSRISEDEARATALADFAPDATVASAQLLEGEPPLEFRGGRMPVYQVLLNHPKKPHIYICPVTGEVLKRRNKLWRIFDFFWMLHIMDYGERKDFNHWLLTAMSVLAILTSATGIILWWWRRPKWLRLRHQLHEPIS